MRACGEMVGELSREPAGTTTVRPLRVWWGRGEPQVRQNVVAKLLADGKSYRVASSSPDSHSKFPRSK